MSVQTRRNAAGMSSKRAGYGPIRRETSGDSRMLNRHCNAAEKLSSQKSIPEMTTQNMQRTGEHGQALH
jgi:hypothetical protein